MTFGERVRRRREMIDGLSQEKLAKLVGYKCRSAINKVELGIIDVSQDKVMEYAKALKTSPAYLMGWIDDPELTHEETLQLEKESNTKIIAADMISSSPTIISTMPKENLLQQKRNKLADKIKNSDYSEEELDKIEQMIDVITTK